LGGAAEGADDMTINAYPLQWTTGWKRTTEAQRRYGRSGRKVLTASSFWKRHEDITTAQAVQPVL
jgi:hypothetical protein